jgi:hypothetical protein
MKSGNAQSRRSSDGVAEFIVNLKAAKQIGLTIPISLFMRADKVFRCLLELLISIFHSLSLAFRLSVSFENREADRSHHPAKRAGEARQSHQMTF